MQAAEAESIILREHVHGGGAGSQADQEVLDLMETQLHKLSDIVRAKEAEITAMRITVQVGYHGWSSRGLFYMIAEQSVVSMFGILGYQKYASD